MDTIIIYYGNAAHIVSVQEAITYGLSGLRWTASKDIVKHYTRGTAPAEDREQVFVDEVIRELSTSVDRLEENYQQGVFTDYQPYKVKTGYEMTSIEDAIKFNIFHEGLHFGYIMSLRGKVKDL